MLAPFILSQQCRVLYNSKDFYSQNKERKDGRKEKKNEERERSNNEVREIEIRKTESGKVITN